MCVCACVRDECERVWVCVRESERVREIERECICASVRVVASGMDG